MQIHSVDAQGTKTRIRSCHPAEHGGKPCPEKNKENLKLYEEKMDCSRVDCESMPAIIVKSLRMIIVMIRRKMMTFEFPFGQNCSNQVTVQLGGLVGQPAPRPAAW